MNKFFIILGFSVTACCTNFLLAASEIPQKTALESTSKDNKKDKSGLQNTLKVSDKNGHTLKVEAIDNSGKLFNILLSGFQPNESVEFESQSCNEYMRNTITMDGEGKIVMGYAPAVIGKNEGPFCISFTNENTQLSIKHYWGPIAFFSRPS